MAFEKERKALPNRTERKVVGALFFVPFLKTEKQNKSVRFDFWNVETFDAKGSGHLFIHILLSKVWFLKVYNNQNSPSPKREGLKGWYQYQKISKRTEIDTFKSLISRPVKV